MAAGNFEGVKSWHAHVSYHPREWGLWWAGFLSEEFLLEGGNMGWCGVGVVIRESMDLSEYP